MSKPVDFISTTSLLTPSPVISRLISKVMGLLLACVVGVGGFLATGNGATLHAKSYGSYETIKVTSRFSPNKSVVVPVREARKGGLEVRLPGGNWIHCAQDCGWTVQKYHLDFWEYQQNPFGPSYVRLNNLFNQ